jgi:hypothetical protein
MYTSAPRRSYGILVEYTRGRERERELSAMRADCTPFKKAQRKKTKNVLYSLTTKFPLQLLHRVFFACF